MKSNLPEGTWPDRFSEEQYDLLTGCANAGDFKAWGLFRKQNLTTPILLEGADFSCLDLTKADLRKAKLARANFSSAKLIKTVFMAADLTEAVLNGSTLEGTDFVSAKLGGARITSVNGSDVKFRFAELKAVAFHEARFVRTNFDHADLSRATFQSSIIRDSNLSHTNMCGTKIVDSFIEGSMFCVSIVDGETLIWNCAVDHQTDFTGIGLSSARIEPSLLSRLETNIRKIWWKSWYDARLGDIKSDWRKFIKMPLVALAAPFRIVGNFLTIIGVRAFWWSTDYGSSTMRILGLFMVSCLFYASLYTLFPFLVNDEIIQTSPDAVLRFVRSLYFSVVAITTVGFGDIAANRMNIASHFVVMSNVIIGYTILTALVVRMGILFTSMPAGVIKPRLDDPTASLDAFKPENMN